MKNTVNNKTPWSTDNWFVSPWNYDPSITAELNFPKRVQFHDITLRDGEQQTGLAISQENKIRIAEMMAEVGVDRLEAGMPAVSPDDEAAIRAIVKRNLPLKVFGFARCMIEDVKRAVDCGVEGVVIEIPSSEHIIQRAYGWSLEKAIELSIEATAYAGSQGMYTVFFPIDASRADAGWVLNLLEQVATHGHMDAVAAVDTLGGMSPQAAGLFVRKIKERINKPVEAHFHDDFGLAVANTLAAVANGADVVHTTVGGIGERAGNASYESVALALASLYGQPMHLNTTKMADMARLLEEIMGTQFPINKSIIGRLLYAIESGIVASWYENCHSEHPLEIYPIEPTYIGHQPASLVLGKNSGIDSVRNHLKRLGLEDKFSQKDQQELVVKVKEVACAKPGLLSADEFKAVVLDYLTPRL